MSQYIVAQVEEQRAGLYMQRFAVQYSALPGGVLTAVVEHGQREVVEGVVLQLPSSNSSTVHHSNAVSVSSAYSGQFPSICLVTLRKINSKNVMMMLVDCA